MPASKVPFKRLQPGEPLPAIFVYLAIGSVVKLNLTRGDLDRVAWFAMECKKALVFHISKFEFTARKAILRVELLIAAGRLNEAIGKVRGGSLGAVGLQLLDCAR